MLKRTADFKSVTKYIFVRPGYNWFQCKKKTLLRLHIISSGQAKLWKCHHLHFLLVTPRLFFNSKFLTCHAWNKNKNKNLNFEYYPTNSKFRNFAIYKQNHIEHFLSYKTRGIHSPACSQVCCLYSSFVYEALKLHIKNISTGDPE